ncbi:MAG: hypothetical protein KAS80_05510, partial [Anaerolineales bacterium]|nr:hypothetical protein [Anaerolineales bacterium]
SNVSNQVPNKMRPLLDRVYMIMLMAAGLDAAILNPLDKELMGVIQCIETRDESTPANTLCLKLFDRVASMEQLQPEDVDMSDPLQAEIWKTVQVLLNQVIYTDSYLQF